MWLYYLLLAVGAVKTGVNGERVIGGNVQLSSDNKTLTLQLQLEGVGGPQGPQGGQGAGGGSRLGAFTDEEQQGLDTHNEFRTTHVVPLMTLDREMCDKAKAYAAKLAQSGTMMHSSDAERPGQGENLSMGCSSSTAQTVKEAVTNWYNEVCYPGYNFNSGGFSKGTGHFTQVVWKESTKLGIGRAESEEGGMKCAYIVGRYKPAGNTKGKYGVNVLKGSFDANKHCASVSSWKKKFLDKQGMAVANISTKASEFAQTHSTESPKVEMQRFEVLKKKKATVAQKHD